MNRLIKRINQGLTPVSSQGLHAAVFGLAYGLGSALHRLHRAQDRAVDAGGNAGLPGFGLGLLGEGVLRINDGDVLAHDGHVPPGHHHIRADLAVLVARNDSDVAADAAYGGACCSGLLGVGAGALLPVTNKHADTA